MNVLILSPYKYDTAPSARFRFEQWARALEAEGIRFTFDPFLDDALHELIYKPGRFVRKAAGMVGALVRRFGVLTAVRDYDLVLLHREAAMVGPAVIERLIARRGVPIVYDLDDPVWIPYRSLRNPLFSWLRWPSKAADICRLAARVIVGNRLLAGWASQYSRNVDVVPSTVDLDRYPVKAGREAGTPITLGWTGSHSTLPFLELAAGALRPLSAKHRLRLLVISHTDRYQLEGVAVEVEARRWRAASEAHDLHGMDIGLAPFDGRGWTPWRCHGKVLQYMAAGVPTVASRIGIIPDYIRDGTNGFLAVTDQDWTDTLSALIEDEGLRRQIGRAGRRTIEDEYSIQVWAPRVRAILESAASGTRRRGHP